MEKAHETQFDAESLSQYRARLRAAQADRRPLIDLVSNQWRDEKEPHPDDVLEDDTRELGFCDLEEEGSCASGAQSLCASRRFRRMIAVLLLVALTAYYIWSRLIQPWVDEDWAYKEGFVSQDNGTYGIAQGGDLDTGLVRTKDLDLQLLPGGPSDPEGKRRLVFVGDVHGCRNELLKLLDTVNFREETDHLVLVGDTISKGPDNVGVLNELIRLNAWSVRGNHEDLLLHVADSLSADTPPPTEKSTSKGFAKDAAILKELKPHHLTYLRDMPLMIHIPKLPQALPSTTKIHSPINEHILVVHAGLVPGVRLAKQDPYFVMNMRSINRRTHVPSALRETDRNARPWFDVWAWYNERVFKGRSLTSFSPPVEFSDEEKPGGPHGWLDAVRNFFRSRTHALPMVVVYGHDSKQGLQIKRWSKGLDSGCVGGGELTAMVLDAKGRTELHSIGCENYRSRKVHR